MLKHLLNRCFDKRTIPNHRGGGELMRRWHLIPRNRVFNLYVHEFVEDDDVADGPHDHPWDFVSVALWRGYHEDRPGRPPRRRIPFVPVLVRAEAAHAVRLVGGRPSWSMILTGSVRRPWGFHRPGLGWISASDLFLHRPYGGSPEDVRAPEDRARDMRRAMAEARRAVRAVRWDAGRRAGLVADGVRYSYDEDDLESNEGLARDVVRALRDTYARLLRTRARGPTEAAVRLITLGRARRRAEAGFKEAAVLAAVVRLRVEGHVEE